MSRPEHITYVKIHKVQPDDAVESSLLKIDSRSQRVIDKIPIVNSDALSPCPPLAAFEPAAAGDALRFKKRFNFTDSSMRVIKISAADELNPLQLAASHGDERGGYTIDHHSLDDDDDDDGCCDEDEDEDDPGEPQMRESKVPNIPMMIRCQNCDTNFPTKYQFQRHQCEFNADKVVLKPNVDAKDGDKGVRMKFDCPTCSKQFVSKNNLDRHLTSHDQDNVNICEYCHKQFVSENRLRIHKENHCKKAGDINKFYRSDVTVWRCTKCFQVFSSDWYANAHSQHCADVITDPAIIEAAGTEVTQVVEPLQNKETAVTTYLSEFTGEDHVSVQPGALEMSMRFIEKVRTEMLLQCEFCNRTYANKKSMLYHQETHTTRVNYSCVMCTETFASYVDAAKHWLTSCTSEANLFFLPKLIFCKCCDRTFKSHEILYLHKVKKKHYTPKLHVLDVADPNNKQEAENSDVSQVGKNGTVDASDTVVPSNGNMPKILSISESSDVSGSPPSTPEGANGDELLDDIKEEFEDDVDDPLFMVDNTDELSSLKEELDEDEGSVTAKEISDKSLNSSENSSSAPLSEVQDVDTDNVPSPSDESKCLDLKRKRGRKPKQSTPNEKGKKTGQQLQPGYKYQCERCTMVFDGVAELEAHRNADHPANYKCDECDQVVHSSKALMIHSRAHQSLKPYVCEICKRCYSQTSHLWQHMRFHQGIKPFACPHEGCEARYTIRPDLKDHIRKVHTRERPFKCSVCDKCFLTGSVYYQHRLIHTNDRRYACDLCNKRFFRADALNNHRRIHTDERPYPCNVCGRHFRQKGDRNKHVRTQHPDYTGM